MASSSDNGDGKASPNKWGDLNSYYNKWDKLAADISDSDDEGIAHTADDHTRFAPASGPGLPRAPPGDIPPGLGGAGMPPVYKTDGSTSKSDIKKWVDDFAKRQKGRETTAADMGQTGFVGQTLLALLLRLYAFTDKAGVRTSLLIAQVLLGIASTHFNTRIETASNDGVSSLDMTFGRFSEDDLYGYVAGYGADGRSWWLSLELLEFAQMVVSAGFWATMGATAYRNAFGDGSPLCYMALIPLVTMNIDFIENMLALTILGSFPEQRLGVAQAYLVMIKLKWVFFSLGVMPVMAAGVLILARWIADRRGGEGASGDSSGDRAKDLPAGGGGGAKKTK